MAHSTTSFNAVFDSSDGGNLQNDMFSRTISMMSRRNLLQKNRTHSFKAALREVSISHPAVKDNYMSSDNDCLNIESKIHPKNSNSHRKMLRKGICLGRDKNNNVTSPNLQSAPMYLGENDAKIFGRTRVTKPLARKTSVNSQEHSASLLLKNTIRENDDVASGPNPTTYHPYPDSWTKKPQRGLNKVPFLSTIQGKKKRRKTFTNFMSNNLPLADSIQNRNQKGGDSRTTIRRGSCPVSYSNQDPASLRLFSPSFLSNQDSKEKPCEPILRNGTGNTENSPALISRNTVGDDSCDDSIFSMSIQLSKDVNDGIELSRIGNVDDSTSDSPYRYDQMHHVENDMKINESKKDNHGERRKLNDNRNPLKSPVARKLSYSGGCMFGNAPLSSDISDQLPSLEIDALNRTLQRRHSQGVLEHSEITDQLNLIGTAVSPGTISLRLPRSCASPGGQRRARTHQLSVQTVRTANDTDTEGDGCSLFGELGQSDSWYEGSVGSINVVFSPPKPVVKISPRIKLEVENEGSVNKRGHESHSSDAGKSYLPFVSSIGHVPESDPRSLLSSSDLSSESHNQGIISDFYVCGHSSKFSFSSREESLELPSFIDKKLQIGGLESMLIQSNNSKLSRALTDKMEENKKEICDKIPAIIAVRINHLRIGKNNLGKKVIEIINENTISRRNRIEALGSHIFKSSNFLRPVCRHPSMQATVHMTHLSDKVLEKTLHLINHEGVCKV